MNSAIGCVCESSRYALIVAMPTGHFIKLGFVHLYFQHIKLNWQCKY